MPRKTALLALALVMLILGTVGVVAGIILKHQPAFYRAALITDRENRVAQSREFAGRFWNLIDSVDNPDWWEIFTAEQINSFLQEDFIRSWGGDNNLPDGFHDLRVQIEENKLRLGCRYGTGFWSTVVSIDLKMWLVDKEVNLIGMELLNLRAGALPVSRQIMLDHITETARRSNIECTWYHREGNPVAILKLQADQARPTIQLERFDLRPGKIIIVGRSTESYFTHSPGKPKAK
jgi:hypothetical protein